ncbi:hypothetical protein OFO01_07715 [Campylobacter sp. JMF_01 NE2]|uniref:hypothetical protein n=1 Tax=unclassified Campylobacter TaxID=2593542 RepID=UPI0022E9D62C|nr:MULTISPECIES: hypothetical protein [unclassified Campylobacter]MDA3053310.1 hypothetical protein [Campylobacter sp. JMF_03 NE3]MDA3067670.1 hypothetical protein [Campylobacter sp. JMF_01 NE2]
MGLADELGNNLDELNTKDIQKPKKQEKVTAKEVKPATKQKTGKAKFVVIALGLLVAFVSFRGMLFPQDAQVSNSDTNASAQSTAQSTPPPATNNSNQQNSVAQSNEVAIKTETPNTNQQNTNFVVMNTPTPAPADSNSSAQSNVETVENWHSRIEYVFLSQKPKINLEMQYPIVEIGNLNFASNSQIEIKELNAIIEPIFFSTNGANIFLNIKIIKADERSISLTKNFSLSEYGFKPMYFEDSVFFNDRIYLPNDRILFFTLKSITNQGDYIQTVFNYLNQDIVVMAENGR